MTVLQQAAPTDRQLRYILTLSFRLLDRHKLIWPVKAFEQLPRGRPGNLLGP